MRPQGLTETAVLGVSAPGASWAARLTSSFCSRASGGLMTTPRMRDRRLNELCDLSREKIERLKLFLYCCYIVFRGRRAVGIHILWNFRNIRKTVRRNNKVVKAVPPGSIPLHWSRAPFPAVNCGRICGRQRGAKTVQTVHLGVSPEGGMYGTDLSSQHKYYRSRQ